METLHGKPVFVATRDGQFLAVGRFLVETKSLLDQGPRVELVFETEVMACRLRVPQQKIADVKATWNGRWYRYRLAAGEDVWKGARRGAGADKRQLPGEDQASAVPAQGGDGG